MEIKFNCPECGQKIAVEQSASGAILDCPSGSQSLNHSDGCAYANSTRSASATQTGAGTKEVFKKPGYPLFF
jgi:ribosomal protein L37AE/L43A